MTQAFWGPEPWRWESGGDGELEQLLGVTHKPSLPSPRWCLVPLIEPENLKTFLAVDLRVPQTVPQIDSLFPPSLYLPPPCILLVNGITFYWADQAGQLLCICHPLHHWVLLLSFIFCKAHIFFFFFWKSYCICYNNTSVFCLVFWLRGTWDLSFSTRYRTCTSCIGRPSLNHWTAGEVAWILKKKKKTNLVS